MLACRVGRQAARTRAALRWSEFVKSSRRTSFHVCKRRPPGVRRDATRAVGCNGPDRPAAPTAGGANRVPAAGSGATVCAVVRRFGRYARGVRDQLHDVVGGGHQVGDPGIAKVHLATVFDDPELDEVDQRRVRLAVQRHTGDPLVLAALAAMDGMVTVQQVAAAQAFDIREEGFVVASLGDQEEREARRAQPLDAGLLGVKTVVCRVRRAMRFNCHCRRRGWWRIEDCRRGIPTTLNLPRCGL